VDGDGEERVGEHGEADVAVPGVILADPVVVQAGSSWRTGYTMTGSAIVTRRP
jgi:hypothetical protein